MKTKLISALTAIVLFIMPNVNFGQTPDLGDANGFVLFTAAGEFDVLGASTVVTGDVGTYVGAFTGFPPGNLNGQIYGPGDPLAFAAAADVATAYQYLDQLTCGLVKTTPLGGGEILLPNIYCIGEAAVLNGDITLDGQGDPDALFIFQINGAFAPSENSRVLLVNGASLCNVWWQINGAFSLAAGALFRGNVIAGGAIHLLEGSDLYGRALTTAGAIDLHNNIVTLEVCGTAPAVPISTWALVLGGALIALFLFVRYRRMI